jgi:hypothetical protein
VGVSGSHVAPPFIPCWDRGKVSRHRTRSSRARRPRRTGRAARVRNRAFERVEERKLAREDAHARLRKVEPCRAVDLGERLHPPGTRRPLHLERGAPQRRRIEVRFGRPRDDVLAALLPQLAERDEVAFDREADLLRDLAPRRGERLLVRLDLALREAPGAGVLLRPVRTARVDEQDLERAGGAAEEEEPGAALRRRQALRAPSRRAALGAGGSRSRSRPRRGAGGDAARCRP